MSQEYEKRESFISEVTLIKANDGHYALDIFVIPEANYNRETGDGTGWSSNCFSADNILDQDYYRELAFKVGKMLLDKSEIIQEYKRNANK